MVMRGAAAAALALIVGASAAQADVVFKGTAVVTAVTNTAVCLAEYDVGEAFAITYRAKVSGEPAKETLQGIGTDGAYLITATSSGGLLRGGGATARIDGVAYAQPVTVTSTTLSLTSAPATIAASTNYVTLSGYINNLAIPGCRVTFRMSLARLP
ncbi:hypothetical protein [Methylopila sp. 73B]|uniref:hypothetical protein n=1 Tax=Methylopila sp. 73B TaxID=1120792 RepID=UPI000372D7E2|nr:hypothetical protein [Methylopila sp. 73B]